MGSSSRYSYQRLENEEGWLDDDLDEQIGKLRLSSNFRLPRRAAAAAVHVKRRSAVKVRIPSLRRFLGRKARVVKIAWRKVVKRLKESQSHFGDLFAGNYLFLQVTPTPLKYHHSGGRPLKPNYCITHNDRFSSSSLYSISKMA